MDVAYIQFGGVLLGGLIALAGGALAHRFATDRESKSRTIDGLREVARELEKRGRLSLDIAQLVNVGLRGRTPDQFAHDAFSIVGWKDAALALHERPWRFSCLAFLPEAVTDFEALDRAVGSMLDVHDQPLVPEGVSSQDRIAKQIHECVRAVESKIESRLRQLL